MANNNKVIISVDKDFFKNVFEPSRIELQSQLGIKNLSQPKFTKMLNRSGYKMKLGKKKNVFKNK